MTEVHRAYLSLGSNIEAEVNLPKAVQMLGEVGEVKKISSVWESHAVGSDGPNFLNACVLFLAGVESHLLKEQIIRPIENALGRVRSADKNAPRTIDIDILMFDGRPMNVDFWDVAFVAVPLAELIPDFIHPLRNETLRQTSERLSKVTWIVKREDVVIS
jgi:2-amino-4-hydroxy-6-hydroxymethyldihydropteridine diphosphokinase